MEKRRSKAENMWIRWGGKGTVIEGEWILKKNELVKGPGLWNPLYR